MIANNAVVDIKRIAAKILAKYEDWGARIVYEESDFAIIQLDASTVFRKLEDPTSLVLTTNGKIAEHLTNDEYWLDETVDEYPSNPLLLILTPPGNPRNAERLINKTGLQRQPIVRADQLLVPQNPAKVFRGVVLDKVTDLQTTLSPYQINRFAAKSMFFGREKELNKLRRGQGNLIITGARRIGKSSLAIHLQRELGTFKKFASLLGQADQPLKKCAYVDVHTLGALASVQIWRTILKEFNIDMSKVYRSRKKLKVTTAKRLVARPDIEGEARLLDDIIGKFNGQLTIILDEVDGWILNEAPANWPTMNQLRALTDGGRARVILVGYETLLTASSNENFPFAARGDDILLSPLDRDAAANLVKKPLEELNVHLEPEAELLEAIWKETSGAPHLVQDICAKLVEICSGGRTRRNVLTRGDLTAAIQNSKPYSVFSMGVAESGFPLARAIAGITSFILCRNSENKRLQERVPTLEESEYYGKDSISTGGIRDLLDRAGYLYEPREFDLALTYLNLRLILKPKDLNKTLWCWVNQRRRETMVDIISKLTYNRWENDVKREHDNGRWRERYKVLGCF